MQNAWLRSHIHHNRKHVHHARRQPPAVTHMMPTLASRWHALLNTSAICTRLGHDRETTANVSQTAAMTTKCNCRLPRNLFRDQASVALPKPCARSVNSAPSHVLEMPLESFALRIAARARQLRMLPRRRLHQALSRSATCIRLGHDRMTTATATAD